MNRDSLIVGDLILEVGAASVNKSTEGICGDFWCQTGTEDEQILVLSDGMGSGVKANILATLTAKMLSSMLAGSIPIDECVLTVSETLPMCKERKLAYATFTALKLQGLTAYLVRYDNPPSLLIRHGTLTRFPYSVHFVGEKEIQEALNIANARNKEAFEKHKKEKEEYEKRKYIYDFCEMFELKLGSSISKKQAGLVFDCGDGKKKFLISPNNLKELLQYYIDQGVFENSAKTDDLFEDISEKIVSESEDTPLSEFVNTLRKEHYSAVRCIEDDLRRKRIQEKLHRSSVVVGIFYRCNDWCCTFANR